MNRKLSLLIFGIGLILGSPIASLAQTSDQGLVTLKKSVYTPVKNQAATGTCWSFSTVSLIESQSMKAGLGEFDLSEMYIARNIYIEKARNYILRQGAAQFGEGGLGHDVIRAMDRYGAMPESVYSGLPLGKKFHDHNKLESKLKSYLDSLLSMRPIPSEWMSGFQAILDDHLGKPPETFMYQERPYTPQSFAKEVLHFKAEDYVNITSFTHHPFYSAFVLEVPDNFSNGLYYNVPLDEMIRLAEQALDQGLSVMWDADVSNNLFRQKEGYALQWKTPPSGKSVSPDDEEIAYTQDVRQQLFENLTTEDDHLMHLVGLEKSKGGKKFFLVKNSWGEIGPFKGLIHVSETYFAINTISLVIPKSALDNSLKSKLGLH